jgi:ankyrin repeat protein
MKPRKLLYFAAMHAAPVRRCRRIFCCLLLCLATNAAMAQSREAPFYEPILRNDLGALHALGGKPGAAAAMRDAKGSTALMYAAAIGSVEAVKLLVEAGAGVNDANALGATALMWCAGDAAKARYLVSKGADVNARAKTGRTPLLIAALYDGSAEIGQLLLSKGADPKAVDTSGTTVLHAAANSNNIEFARLLLERGADPNAVDAAGFTPLTAAAQNGDRGGTLVKMLLARGVRVDPVCAETLDTAKNGPLALGLFTPLILAAGQGSLAAVEALVKAGANVNAADVRGMTPLMTAIATDHADPRVIRLLLEKRAYPDRKSKKGESAYDWARTYNNPEVLKALGIAGRPLREASLPPVGDATPTVRNAVEKSVALLQRTSREFQVRGGCPACHAQHHTGLAVATAKEAGAKVDWALEQAEARTAGLLRGSLEQTLLQVIDPPPGTDGHVFSLLQMQAAGLPPKIGHDSVLFHLMAMQRKEGDWPNYGALRPPFEDGSFTITAKAIKVLRDGEWPGRREEMRGRIAKAAQWLTQASPITTEDRTMQLLGLRWAGARVSEHRVRELLALQRRNGGWGQTEHLPADAYATGEALYTLRQAGIPASDARWRTGVEFLLRTQLPDGSWHVVTRAAGFQPYFESGFPHGHDQWISQSGTAWAVMALSAAGL